jgi:pimeloyl-ACP methyl ester carboxylesterase
VLVHGGWGHPEDWRWVQELLAGVAVTTDAVDLPSHRFARATRSDDVDVVEAAVCRASPPVVAVGWSYGGAVIGDMDVSGSPVAHLLYVASVPKVVDTSTFGEPPALRPDLSLVLFPTPETCVLDDERWLEEGHAGSRFPAEVVRHLREHRRRPQALGALLAPPRREAWRQVATTLLLGRRDQLLPAAMQHWAAQLPVSTTVVDGDHFLCWTHPRTIADRVLELLAPS